MLRVDELAQLTEEHYRQIRTQGELRDNDTITDKQLNGFKIEHTGSAAKVSVKYIVEGGMV